MISEPVFQEVDGTMTQSLIVYKGVNFINILTGYNKPANNEGHRYFLHNLNGIPATVVAAGTLLDRKDSREVIVVSLLFFFLFDDVIVTNFKVIPTESGDKRHAPFFRVIHNFKNEPGLGTGIDPVITWK